jgi:pSer/pThr/pTyr-binding forkhead associated (FHA) protein
MPDGQEVALTGQMTIGRSIENSIKLEDGGASRKHAALEVAGTQVLLRDLGSSNGTWVNDQRINAPVELKDGDLIRISATTLLFRAGESPTAPMAGGEGGATQVYKTTELMTLVRGDGAEYGLSHSLRIGRSRDNDIALADDASASQAHAKIDVVVNNAVVADLNSRNGTWVNGARITGPTTLKHGDKVMIGDTVFRLRLGSRPLPAEETAEVKRANRMGCGLLVGGGLLSLVGLGAIGVALLVGAIVAYPLLFPAPTATPLPTINPQAAATQRAQVEGRALRALVQIVVPVGDPNNPQGFSTGSGSLLHKQGYVLTNFHVVGDPKTGNYYNNEGWVGIALNWDNPSDAPNTFYRCEVLLADPDLDLALVRVYAEGDGGDLPSGLTFPTLPVGDSDELNIGDPIAIIGYPGLGGDTPTFTRGTVSGFLTDEFLNLDRGWIKTDAEINRGNSGGMAINERGELIGVPTLVFSDVEVSGKIGEVRPIRHAQKFLDEVPK